MQRTFRRQRWLLPPLKAKEKVWSPLIKELGLVPSNGEGFRTIEQGGLSVNGEKVTNPKQNVTKDMFRDGEILIQKGKRSSTRS